MSTRERDSQARPATPTHWLSLPGTVRRLWVVFAVVLAVTVAAEAFVHMHPRFRIEGWFAFHAGYGYSVDTLINTFQFMESRKHDTAQVVMNGNEAIGYGLIAAGVRFGAGYPITPWSDIMELLRRELPR